MKKMKEIHESKILLVDDEIELCHMVKDILRGDGYQRIFTAYRLEQACQLLRTETPHIMILDVMLPDGDGFQFIQEVRQNSQIPVLFLSAKDEDEDRLLGLGLGADDYLTKPLLPRELLLRLQIILRRTYLPITPKEQKKPVFFLGNREIDLNSGTVKSGDDTQQFTAKEFVLLEKLVENQGNIVTGDALCQAAWGDHLYSYENTLMVHIRRLREKIEAEPSNPQHLLTVRGLGYKLVGKKEIQ
jgi:two-component system, OmpR family, response regulator VicR